MTYISKNGGFRGFKGALKKTLKPPCKSLIFLAFLTFGGFRGFNFSYFIYFFLGSLPFLKIYIIYIYIEKPPYKPPISRKSLILLAIFKGALRKWGHFAPLNPPIFNYFYFAVLVINANMP